jgi:trehalose 6-phosphate phosphatase
MAIQTISTLEMFFSRLKSARSGVLMLDFDGTLAPFSADRNSVRVYVPVTDLLQKIASTNTRLVFISGRKAREVSTLIPLPASEIWGSHGMERLLPDGTYEVAPGVEQFERFFNMAVSLLDNEKLGSQIERKVGSLAVHWRGLPEKRQLEIKSLVLRVWGPLAAESRFAINDFDGGVELRVPTRDKGYAVRTVLNESPQDIPSAYLGDDVTDEAAFHAIAEFGLAILVRPEFRVTAAQLWLRPPQDLVRFLEHWLEACGGAA